MQHALSAHKKEYKKETFVDKVQRNLPEAIQDGYMLLSLIVISIGGTLLHLLDYAIVKTIFGFIMPRFVVYIVGQYLTLLPTYIILVLLCLPVRASFPIVFLSAFFSFFILFAI